MTSDVIRGQSECILLAGLNVGLKLFAFIFALVVIVFGISGLLSVQSCLSTSFLIWCFLCGVVHRLRIPRLPQEKIESFLRNAPEKENIIGHRGGADNGPENTLAAFEEAKKHGAFAVEVDVGITKDGIAVLLHDWTVDRTTDGKGMLSDMTYDEVKSLDAAAKFANRTRFASERIPTLEECVEKCRELDLKIFFDVKDSSDKAVSILVELYHKYPHLVDSSMVCSFKPSLVYKLRRRNRGILTALTMTSRFFQHELEQFQMKLGHLFYTLAYIADKFLVWSMYNWLWYLCGNSAVLLCKDEISGSVIDYWKDRDIHVVPWTVNELEEKKYFQDFYKLAVITDRLHHEGEA